MLMDILLLVIGLAGLIFSLKLLQITFRVKKGIKHSTYSKNVDRARIESGIYVEHGMVNVEKNDNVKPEYKLSNSFFESIH
jgi:hypothetical protein